MYLESDELTCKVSSLKVTIRLVLGGPRDQKLKPVGLCPRDTERRERGEEREDQISKTLATPAHNGGVYEDSWKPKRAVVCIVNSTHNHEQNGTG